MKQPQTYFRRSCIRDVSRLGCIQWNVNARDIRVLHFYITYKHERISLLRPDRCSAYKMRRAYVRTAKGRRFICMSFPWQWILILHKKSLRRGLKPEFFSNLEVTYRRLPSTRQVCTAVNARKSISLLSFWTSSRGPSAGDRAHVTRAQDAAGSRETEPPVNTDVHIITWIRSYAPELCASWNGNTDQIPTDRKMLADDLMMKCTRMSGQMNSEGWVAQHKNN
jgi:hypothetical protein